MIFLSNEFFKHFPSDENRELRNLVSLYRFTLKMQNGVVHEARIDEKRTYSLNPLVCLLLHIGRDLAFRFRFTKLGEARWSDFGPCKLKRLEFWHR